MLLILYRIYQFTIYWPILLLATIFTALSTIIGSFIGCGRGAGYYIPCLWSRLFCLMTFVKVEVTGRDNISKGKSYVFVANHQGAYDIFSIYGYLNHQFRWMMKKSLEKIPLIGKSCRMSGQIYVDNSSPAAIKETMEEAKEQIASGMSVVVFPEGSRTWNGKVGRFKRGAYTLAEEFKLPVVPITIDGSYQVMPRTAKLPHWGTIRLIIHAPIMPSADGHDLPTLMEESRSVILADLGQTD